MSPPPASAFDLSIDAWRQACNALLAMPKLALSALALVFLCALAFAAAGYGVVPTKVVSLGLAAVLQVRSIIQLAIIASVLIAVHRFVILGLVEDRFVWQLPFNYGRFVGWLLVQFGIFLAFSILSFCAGLVWAPLGGVVTLCGSITTVIVQYRLLLLFPAIAVNAPGADRHRAWQDSRGHAWRFFGVTLLSLLPIIIASVFILIIGLVVAAVAGRNIAMNVVPALLSFLLLLLYLVLASVGAALASRFFQIYGHAVMLRGSSSPGTQSDLVIR